MKFSVIFRLKGPQTLCSENALTIEQFVPVIDVELRALGSATLFEPTRNNMGHKIVNSCIRQLWDQGTN